MSVQRALTVQVRIRPGQERPLREILELIVDQDVETNDICPFKNLVTVHFARFVILEKAKDAYNRDIPATLILSTNYDGSLARHLEELADVAAGGLNEVFRHCVGYPGPGRRTAANLVNFLHRHRIPYGAFYVGLAGRSVEMVDRDDELQSNIQSVLDRDRRPETSVGKEPHRIVEGLRASLNDIPAIAWFNEEPTWVARLTSAAGWVVILAALLSGLGGVGGAVLYATESPWYPWLSDPQHWLHLIAGCSLAMAGVVIWVPQFIALAPPLVGTLLVLPILTPFILLGTAVVAILPGVEYRGSLLPFAIAPVVLIALWLVAIRVEELLDKQTPVPVDEELIRSIRDLTRSEDHVVQNQLTHLVNIKKGQLRLITLFTFLTVINFVARFFQRDGALGGISTIHFARWCIIDGGRRLIFFSNFDGSWEEYLGDFVDRASWGLTGIWSNTVNFPKTRWLVLDGATDEQRFKLWGRKHQVPTPVWYSRRKRLTLRNIVRNRAIRRGLFASLGRKQSREWLRRL